MKQKAIFILIGLFAFICSIQGQTNSNSFDELNMKKKYAIGAYGGCNFFSGGDMMEVFDYGLVFRYTPNKFGFQATFGPYKDNDEKILFIGFDLMYQLATVEKTTFYLFQNNQLRYYKRIDLEGAFYNNHGLGLGIEQMFGKRVGMDLTFSFVWYEQFLKVQRKGEIGVFYKF